ncbi:MAG: hypothetical protein MSJ26_06310 [Oscillospiraceae bacterium]|nr:hypothetical protein [Oscillospiraceae bacterium]
MKKNFLFALAAALLFCGCAKNEGSEETESAASLSPDTSSASVTTVPEEEELPEIKFSAKSTFFVEHEERPDNSGAMVNRVIPLTEGKELTFRPADGSGESVTLKEGDVILGWTMDSFLMFSNDTGSFQSRFSSEEREFEGNLTIHISDLTDELEAAFVPNDASQFPKASTDGRKLWFAVDNLEETLEMLGYSPEDSFEKEVMMRVRLKTDRIYINNLPLDDVNNLIRVLVIEKI